MCCRTVGIVGRGERQRGTKTPNLDDEWIANLDAVMAELSDKEGLSFEPQEFV